MKHSQWASPRCAASFVIPATVADRYDQAELVARIKILRELAKNMVQLMAGMHKVIGKMHSVAGLTA